MKQVQPGSVSVLHQMQKQKTVYVELRRPYCDSGVYYLVLHITRHHQKKKRQDTHGKITMVKTSTTKDDLHGSVASQARFDHLGCSNTSQLLYPIGEKSYGVKLMIKYQIF